ncbi:MAG: signal peptidase I, partial [Verrucomicrobia bacterium]
MIDIAGKPLWWIILLFIPFVNIVVSILIMIGMAKNFGRGAG